jgi:tetratricopeptide (TPR) repeat protein
VTEPAAGARISAIVVGVLTLAAATFLAYWPSMHGGVLWDDAAYLTPPALRSLDGLRHVWFMPGATLQYYPALYSTFWLEWHLWQANMIAYHVVKVAEHVLAACLLWGVLRTLRIPGAWFASALFALHPVSVDSVAWISEQKNTLSAVFVFAAAWTYLKSHEHPVPGRGRILYVVALLLFVLAVLSKSVVATLPAVLLVVIWWRRGRVEIRRDVVPLLPWFAVAAAAGVVTAWLERVVVGAQGAGFDLGILQRLLLAPCVVWFYLSKLVWPSPLVFFYPRWTVDASDWTWWLSLVAFLAAAGLLIWWAVRRETGDGSEDGDLQGETPSSRRAPLAAALIFVGTLVPVLGFLNVYPFRYSFVADHFQYLAQVSVFVLVAGSIASVAARRPSLRPMTMGAAVAVLATCGWLTWKQSDQYGHDAIYHYRVILAQNPKAWIAYEDWAFELMRQGRFDEAVPLLRQAIDADPEFFEAARDLGTVLERNGRLDEALPYLERAVRLDPDPKGSENRLGMALLRGGRVAQAIPHLERAVSTAEEEHNPIFQFELDLGRAYVAAGRLESALKEYRDARERAGADYPLPAYDALMAAVLMKMKRDTEAEPYLRRAIEADAGDAAHRLDLGRIEYRTGRYADAERHLSEAIQLRADLVDADVGLAFTYQAIERPADARRTAMQAVEVGRRTLPADVAQRVAETMAPLLGRE